MTETLAIYAAAATDKEFESLPEKHRSRVTKWAHELEWMTARLNRASVSPGHAVCIARWPGTWA